MNKQEIAERQQEILTQIQGFRDSRFNEEYYELTARLTAKLGRKKNVPFVAGQPKIWAAAIVHAVGYINFLFMPSSVPHITIEELNEHFGTKKATVTAKSKLIRDLLKLRFWDPEFSTKEVAGHDMATRISLLNGNIAP